MSSNKLSLLSNTTGRNRNYMHKSHERDDLIEWMKAMLYHSFVLDSTESYAGTMAYFEELIDEYRKSAEHSRLRQFVPTVGKFHTPLFISRAFDWYDTKYCITKRRFVAPTFNEMRHILNLSQVMAIGPKLKMMTFDGDQTLYSDGQNFEANNELASGILSLLINGVKVIVVTAAGYGLNGQMYMRRLQGLLDCMENEKLAKEHVENFFVMGGECNYFLQCTIGSFDGPEAPQKPILVAVPVEKWQAADIDGPKPAQWSAQSVKRLMDLAEESMRDTVSELRLRAKILRKERSIGVYPGGKEMEKLVPVGHGTNKIKREALDELVLRLMDRVRREAPSIDLPVCVFNGGTDAWFDVGNKSVGVAALQAYFKLDKASCIHVGDQVCIFCLL